MASGTWKSLQQLGDLQPRLSESLSRRLPDIALLLLGKQAVSSPGAWKCSSADEIVPGCIGIGGHVPQTQGAIMIQFTGVIVIHLVDGAQIRPRRLISRSKG